MKTKYDTETLIKVADSRFFSDRERQVFDLYFLRKWQIEAIAAELYVCRGTVNNDLRSIREKIPVIVAN